MLHQVECLSKIVAISTRLSRLPRKSHSVPRRSMQSTILPAMTIVVGYDSYGVGMVATNVYKLDRGCGIERIDQIACYYYQLRRNEEVTYSRLIHSHTSKLRGSPKTPFPCRLKWRSATQLVRGPFLGGKANYNDNPLGVLCN